MRRLFLFFFLLSTAHAAEVSTGKSNFTAATSSACVPNGGGVTSGHSEVVFFQSNDVFPLAITSTRVPLWHVDFDTAGSGIRYVFAHGTATSTGAETITGTLTGGSASIGSYCGEYTGSFNVFKTFGISGSINAAAGADIIEVASNAIGAVTVDAPFTQRQSVTSGGVGFVAGGDQLAGAAGAYASAVTPTTGTQIFLLTLCDTCNSHNQSQLVRRDVNEENDWVCNPTLDIICTRKRAEHDSKRHSN